MGLKENKEILFDQVAQICQRVGRPRDSVKIIAVTKYVDSSVARDLVQTGIRHIGENRVDRFLEKYEALNDQELTWHLIGSLQRRKVKDLINYLDYFHALDSLKLAAEIEKRAEKVIKCFLQVNVSKESSKHGFMVEELEQVLPQLAEFRKIKIVGLMTMAPLGASEEEVLSIFKETEELRQKIQAQAWVNMPMTEVSMGMSQDYEEAIEAGATFVRIGSAFFK